MALGISFIFSQELLVGTRSSQKAQTPGRDSFPSPVPSGWATMNVEPCSGWQGCLLLKG